MLSVFEIMNMGYSECTEKLGLIRGEIAMLQDVEEMLVRQQRMQSQKTYDAVFKRSATPNPTKE